MPDETRLRRFAVLIDADNTSPRIAAGLLVGAIAFILMTVMLGLTLIANPMFQQRRALR